MIIKSVLTLIMLIISLLGIRAVLKGKDETIYNAIFMALLYLESDSFFVEMLALFTFTILFFRIANKKSQETVSK